MWRSLTSLLYFVMLNPIDIGSQVAECEGVPQAWAGVSAVKAGGLKSSKFGDGRRKYRRKKICCNLKRHMNS